MIEVILILGGLFLIKSVLSSGQAASDEFIGAYFKMVFLKLKIFASIVFFIGITIVILMIKLDIKKPSLSLSSMLPGLEASAYTVEDDDTTVKMKKTNESSGKKYKKGDIYIMDGKRYKLVDQETYKWANLEGYPEVQLSGKNYWLVKA